MTIIIALCVLLLVAYIFDVTASHTRIPSVILLLLLGWLAKEAATFFEISYPELQSVLPILGNVGLILIVLEGSLELELNATKWPLVKKSIIVSLLPLLGLAFGLAYALQYIGGYSLRDSLLNVIPMCVISSAIAIPTVKSMSSYNKEFVTYESSLSDIMGVLLFNFIVINATFGLVPIGNFLIQVLIIIVVSFLATIGLAYLLNRIEHHIKYVPIIILVILIYAISKEYHLPALMFILLFGLFLGNLDELKRYKWINRLKPDELDIQVGKFRELTVELTFLVRVSFFLLFGFLIQTAEILNPDTILYAGVVVGCIFLIRAIQLLIVKLPLFPLLFIAPRGLITILLFLAIPVASQVPEINKSLIIQVILLSAFVMMIGTFSVRKEENDVHS